MRARRTTQVSRSGASKSAIEGGGQVRFQNVYMLRRWSPSPWSGTYAAWWSTETSSQSPAGCQGFTLGPPIRSASSPEAKSA